MEKKYFLYLLKILLLESMKKRRKGGEGGSKSIITADLLIYPGYNPDFGKEAKK